VTRLAEASTYERSSFRIILNHQYAHDRISWLRWQRLKSLSYEFLLFLYTKLLAAWQAGFVQMQNQWTSGHDVAWVA